MTTATKNDRRIRNWKKCLRTLQKTHGLMMAVMAEGDPTIEQITAGLLKANREYQTLLLQRIAAAERM